MSDKTASLGRSIGKGAAWMVFLRLAVRSLGLVSMIVLARLLAPEDFGLVAMATMLSAAVMVFSEFSLNLVLIHNQAAGRRHYNTAWTLSVIRGVVMTGVLALLAAPAASFFGDERLRTVIYVLAVSALIDGLINIAVVDFQKHLRFHLDFLMMFGGRVASFLTTVTLAVLWRDYWALVAGIIAGALVRLIMSYVLHDYRPRLCLEKWRSIFSFSKWLVATNLVSFLYHRADTFFLGKLLGSHFLGVYTMAHEISNMATTELVVPIRRALLPGFAKVADDFEALSRLYLDAFAMIMMIGAPIAIGIGLVADPATRIFLGDKWTQCIPLIQILAIYGIVNICAASNGAIYVALGKPRLLLMVQGVGVIAMVPLLYLGIGWGGVVGAAAAISAGVTVTAIVDFATTIRLLPVTVGRILTAGWRTIVAALAMIVVVLGIQHALGPGVEPSQLVLRLVLSALGGAATYVGVHLHLWWLAGTPDGPERSALATLRRGRRRILRRTMPANP